MLVLDQAVPKAGDHMPDGCCDGAGGKRRGPLDPLGCMQAGDGKLRFQEPAAVAVSCAAISSLGLADDLGRGDPISATNALRPTRSCHFRNAPWLGPNAPGDTPWLIPNAPGNTLADSQRTRQHTLADYQRTLRHTRTAVTR